MKRKLKKKYKTIFRKGIIICRLIFIIIMLFLIIKLVNKKKTVVIKDITYNDNVVTINLEKDNIYCILSKDEPSLDDNNWIKTENKQCTINYTYGNNKLYLKKDDKIIYESNEVLYYEINEKENIYLALNDTYQLFNVIIGDESKIQTTSTDLLSYDNGIITALKDGNIEYNVTINNNTYTYNITPTSLITIKPKTYDYKKDYLSCNKYSEEENDLLDEILKDRINTVGYKTRAGVVEAARFLTLEFPYRINYFYENGRQTTNNVDGEGRYYHVGLYLNKSRFSNITGKSTGTKTWGCSLYSNPAKRYIDNGLDCSGFVSWTLLNGGFDVKDVGAGFSDNSDLTDFGTLKQLTSKILDSGDVKVGDLLHSYAAGGHIAIIVGIDNDTYYVAQALWYDEIGVIISKYNKTSLLKAFPHIVLMDKYYKEDGNLTNMW